MKKILFLLIIVIAALGFMWWNGNKDVKVNTDNKPANTTFKPDASNATFQFDEGAATLKNGKTESDGGEISLLDKVAYGDLNKDDKQDSAVLLASSGGGSGVFIYAAAYVSGPVNYKGTNAVFLGDRIAPQSVSITSGTVTVTYLDRRPDEPFAAEPTIRTTRQFIFQNGELVEK